MAERQSKLFIGLDGIILFCCSHWRDSVGLGRTTRLILRGINQIINNHSSTSGHVLLFDQTFQILNPLFTFLCRFVSIFIRIRVFIPITIGQLL